MRRGLLTVATLIVMLVVFSLPAAAAGLCIYSSDIIADCDGYTISVYGEVFWVKDIAFDYSLDLTDSNGNVVKTIDVVGYQTGELAVGPQTLTISGLWGEELFGINTVTGSVEYTYLGELLVYPFGPVSFGPCEPPQLCEECDGKVTQLTLQYNGLNAAVIRVEQKKGGVVFEDAVLPGGIFSFIGTDNNGTLGTEISLYVDGALNTNIHTSCSRPIGPGLVSGDFEVIEGYSLNGGLLCEASTPPTDGDCDGKVTQLTLQYNGPGGALVEVMQKMSKPKEPKGEGKKDKGPKDDDKGKKGKGHDDDKGKGKKDKGHDDDKGKGKKDKGPKGKGTPLGIIFSQTLLNGETFTIIGQDNKGTLGTEISIYVDGVLNTKIHTSCSRPIGPGLVSGDFLVIEGYSRNGGLLDPINGIIAKRTVSAPEGLTLSQNYPNPFNPITTISFSLPRSSFVTLKIFNALGEKVKTLVERKEFAGYHSVMWDASEFSSGIYFYQLTAGSFAETKRLMLLK